MNAFVGRHSDLRVVFEEILYGEALLLDSGRYDEWLGLMHEEVRYWAPVRTNADAAGEDFSTPHLMCHIDDGKAALALRVKRLTEGLSYTESPRPRIRHLITNVLVIGYDGEEARVSSNFLVFRSHVGLQDHSLIGSRNDRWINDNGWNLRERQILLDQVTIEGMAVLF